jgi:hypothetical protein
MTGSDNTAIGSKALISNTEGSSNTATGGSALFSNTTGNSNTANGEEAFLPTQPAEQTQPWEPRR